LNRSPVSLVFLLLLAAGPAGPHDPTPVPPETPAGSSPRVELDRLLKLPSTLDYSVEKRGGFTSGEWRSRFEEIRTALETEREGLARAEEDLDRVAGSADAWLVGPPMPGMSGAAAEAPLDYRIRQTMKRHREEIKRLERQLRELEVEANLAAVPEDWRE
jgi:hypothetical protein